MRKFPILLILCLIIICLLSINLFAYAEVIEEEIPYSLILSNPSDYYYFNAPQSICANSNGYAVYDSESIIVFFSGIHNIPFDKDIKEMILIDKYLIVLTTEFEVMIYDVLSNERLIENEDVISSNSDFATSITYDYTANKLYIFCVTNIKVFNVSVADVLSIEYYEQLSIGAQLITSDYISYSSGNLLIYRISTRQLFSYNLTTNLSSVIISNASSSVNKIVSNNEYVFLIEDNKITRYDLNGMNKTDVLITGAANDQSITDIGGVCVLGNYMYISNPSYSAVKVYIITSTGLTFNRMIGSRGSGLTRLNSPSYVSTRDSNVYIADRLNDRIINYQVDSSNNIISAPESIGSSGIGNGQFNKPYIAEPDYSSGLFVADSTGRLQHFIRGTFAQEYQFSNITSIAISGDDTVFVADAEDNKIYYKTKESVAFSLFLSVANSPVKLAISKSGNILYVSDSQEMKAYSIKGSLMPFSIDYSKYSISEPASISVDYSGNIYMLILDLNPLIYRFARNISSYSLSAIFELANDVIPLGSINAINLSSDGRIYLPNTEFHNIAVIDASVSLAVTENSPSFNHPQVIVSPTRIAYVKHNSTIYYNPDNYEDINSIQLGELAPVLNELTYNSVHYYYIEYEGKRAYIRQSDTTLLSAGSAPMDYVKSLHPTLSIYLYPSPNSPKLFSGIDRSILIEVVSNVAVKDGVQVWNWYEVKYLGISGYVLKTEVIPTDMPIVTPQKFFAKIRSPHFGEKVNIYSLQDSHSAVIATLSDGTKVEISDALNKDNEYTLVKYNNITGYVRTEYLVESGLTTGQILSIVLASITFLSTGAVIIISKIIKRDIIN